MSLETRIIKLEQTTGSKAPVVFVAHFYRWYGVDAPTRARLPDDTILPRLEGEDLETFEQRAEAAAIAANPGVGFLFIALEGGANGPTAGRQ